MEDKESSMSRFFNKHWLSTIFWGLVIFYHQQILQFVSTNAVSSLEFINKTATDEIYKGAAKAVFEDFASVPSLIVFTIAYSLPFVFILGYITATKTTFGSENEEEAKIKNFSFYWENYIIFRYASTVFSAFLFIFAIWMFIVSSMSIDLRINFEQSITILRPYISEGEFIKIRSEWAKMTSREDYEDVSSKLATIAKENSIELPEAFTFKSLL